MGDEEIIELFFLRSEYAIHELDTKYGKLFFKIAYNILHNRQDAEECINDAYLGIWNTIPPYHPAQLLPYLCKIIRNHAIARYHANTAIKRNSTYDIALEELEDCLPSLNTVETCVESAALSRMIDSFLQTLSQENRVIFMRRYWFSDTYKQIADRIGIPEKTVSVRLVRIRQKLKAYLTEREVFI